MDFTPFRVSAPSPTGSCRATLASHCRFCLSGRVVQLLQGLTKTSVPCIRDQLEKAETHDELWNAAQNEMVYHGKMHGFMRMYWGKKAPPFLSIHPRAFQDTGLGF